ncbi:MAG TPA: peptide-methionine (R)-S-oxide reductase MsrB [Pirellulaceae bacterium]|nr:peptide-methionine (R)-S-oxide reductase MsrB [Pirellulaceae bacterium]
MLVNRGLAIGMLALLASAWVVCGQGAMGARSNRGVEIERQDDAVVNVAQSTTDGGRAPMVSVKVFNAEGELVGPVEMAKVIKTEREWQLILTPDQFRIARASGTERPFCGTLLDNKKEGVYTCICCQLPLFTSDAKFNSGTGWPSFFQPIAKENIATKMDHSHGMQRVEILCTRCDCHLGHVFNDGPRPTGLRFCVNSESLSFTDAEDVKSLADEAAAHGSDKSDR